jgi:hypothetical protein
LARKNIIKNEKELILNIIENSKKITPENIKNYIKKSVKFYEDAYKEKDIK